MSSRLLRLLSALTLALLLAGQDWAEDQGELVDENAMMTLGADVEAKLGPPAGPPISGNTALNEATTAVASRLRCPSCQGLSVDASPAEAARNMKGQVRAMVGAGYSREQIEDYFVGSYGEFVLMSPRKSGITLLVWVAPIALVLLGLAFALGIVGKKADKEPEEAPDEPGVPPELAPYLDRVRAELESDGA